MVCLLNHKIFNTKCNNDTRIVMYFFPVIVHMNFRFFLLANKFFRISDIILLFQHFSDGSALCVKELQRHKDTARPQCRNQYKTPCYTVECTMYDLQVLWELFEISSIGMVARTPMWPGSLPTRYNGPHIISEALLYGLWQESVWVAVRVIFMLIAFSRRLQWRSITYRPSVTSWLLFGLFVWV